MLHIARILAVVTLAACSHAPTDTLPRQYDCGTAHVVATAGEHFVAAGGDAVAPVDRMADVVTTSGSRCIAAGGYTDALSRFLRTGDEHLVARELGVDDTAAHRLIGQGLLQAHHNYFQQ